ncbi:MULTISPECIES: DUF4396 domain-containing protein [unclassified Alistipes]|uniref:DUF4396 domain-containing protein n=1 Tax=unclassified Alistipes TaxID=2608932 RepID=UPI000C75A704|nr:DUF4396 domain-containing protein [Alistipes sp. cv1]
MNTIAVFFVCSGIVSALVIASDLHSRKQSMKIMNSVWILTGLWGGFIALWAYFRFGRAKRSAPVAAPMRMEAPDAGSMPMGNKAETRMPMDMGRDRPKWQSVVLSTLHCGAGCTLADLIGESFLYFVPVAIGGSAVVGGWALDYALALCIGVYFQYAAIRSMQMLPRKQAVVHALKADFLSLTAWQAGMYAWMAVVIWVLFRETGLSKMSWTFWFMMQTAMFVGFLAALPMNVWLIRKGVKKGM